MPTIHISIINFSFVIIDYLSDEDITTIRGLIGFFQFAVIVVGVIGLFNNGSRRK